MDQEEFFEQLRQNPDFSKRNIERALEIMPKKTEFYEKLSRLLEIEEIPQDALQNAKKPRYKLYSDIEKILLEDNLEGLRERMTEPGLKFDDIYTKNSLLALAARFGSVKCFRHLWLNGAQITEYTFTESAAGGNTEIIQLCIEEMGDHHNSQRIQWFLTNAIIYRHNNVLEWGVEHFSEEIDIDDLLIDAVKYNNPPALICLCNNLGLDLKGIKLEDNSNLLSYTNAPEMVGFLVESGVDVNAIDDFGFNALFGCSNPETVKAFIAAGIDINTVDKFGRNALFTCYDPNVVDYLISLGIDVNLVDKDGKDVLSCHHDPKIIQKIEEAQKATQEAAPVSAKSYQQRLDEQRAARQSNNNQNSL